MSVIVCYNTCWACKFDDHYDEPTPHTWMDSDDAECRGITEWPLPASLITDQPCACACGGGPGGCHLY